MKFGAVDINENLNWTYEDLKKLVEVQLKGRIDATTNQVAKALKVPIPEKPKKEE